MPNDDEPQGEQPLVSSDETQRRVQKLSLLAAAVQDYERANGVITDDEITALRRSDRARATIVRGPSGNDQPGPLRS